MAVFATFCQICSLPVNHDHYVRSPGSEFMKIYRRAQPAAWGSEERVFAFTPEHAWLADCVGVSTRASGVLRGGVTDGELVDSRTQAKGFLADGVEDYLALHGRCWTMMGEPQRFEDCAIVRGQHGLALIGPYQQQLFEFQRLCDSGKAWMLADPIGADAAAVRNRHRIERAVSIARRPRPDGTGISVASLLAADDDWTYTMSGSGFDDLRQVTRYRRHVKPGLDVTGYPHFVCVIKEYETPNALPKGSALDVLESFEVALKDALETDAAAILVSVEMSLRQAQYTLYARDANEVRSRVGRLPDHDRPLPFEYETALDPDWKTYFTEIWPERAPDAEPL